MQKINGQPKNFFSILPHQENNPLVIFIADQFLERTTSENQNKIRRMLIYLYDQVQKTCTYSNVYLNLTGDNALLLYQHKIKNFNQAYFYSSIGEATQSGKLTRCQYNLDNGQKFDLLDNEHVTPRAKFKLSGNYSHYWMLKSKGLLLLHDKLYVCKNKSVLNCPFEIETGNNTL